jgi:hypothetical protein
MHMTRQRAAIGLGALVALIVGLVVAFGGNGSNAAASIAQGKIECALPTSLVYYANQAKDNNFGLKPKNDSDLKLSRDRFLQKFGCSGVLPSAATPSASASSAGTNSNVALVKNTKKADAPVDPAFVASVVTVAKEGVTPASAEDANKLTKKFVDDFNAKDKKTGKSTSKHLLADATQAFMKTVSSYSMDCNNGKEVNYNTFGMVPNKRGPPTIKYYTETHAPGCSLVVHFTDKEKKARAMNLRTDCDLQPNATFTAPKGNKPPTTSTTHPGSTPSTSKSPKPSPSSSTHSPSPSPSTSKSPTPSKSPSPSPTKTTSIKVNIYDRTVPQNVMAGQASANTCVWFVAQAGDKIQVSFGSAIGGTFTDQRIVNAGEACATYNAPNDAATGLKDTITYLVVDMTNGSSDKATATFDIKSAPNPTPTSSGGRG